MKKKLSIQYIAGFFDGEGSVSIAANYYNRKAPAGPLLSFSQRDYKILNQIQYSLGCGAIHTRTKVGSYHLRIMGKKKVIKVAKLLLPYAVVKKAHLSLILEYCDWVRDTSRPCLTQQEIKNRFRLLAKLRKLNHKYSEK